jgi:hypothetical protein
MVIVVPMVQPIPAWTSGMMRILEPAKAAWSAYGFDLPLRRLFQCAAVAGRLCLCKPCISIIRISSQNYGPERFSTGAGLHTHPAFPALRALSSAWYAPVLTVLCGYSFVSFRLQRRQHERHGIQRAGLQH